MSFPPDHGLRRRAAFPFSVPRPRPLAAVAVVGAALLVGSSSPATAQSAGTPEAAATGGATSAELTREAARELRNPLAYDDAAIREGRKHYLRLCQSCHGKDGRALESFDFEATDLTDPERYRHGSTDGDIFFSTREGAGMDMPRFGDKLSDEQVWQVVWFLRSLGPESAQPQSSSPSASSSKLEP